jgi:23S rRNA pseudouridine2605 synthase
MAKFERKGPSNGGKKPAGNRNFGDNPRSSKPERRSSGRSNSSEGSDFKRPSSGRAPKSFGDKPGGNKPKKSYGSDDRSERPKRSFGGDNSERPKRSFGGDSSERPKRPGMGGKKSPFKKFDNGRGDSRPTFNRTEGEGDKPKRSYGSDNRSGGRQERPGRGGKPTFKKTEDSRDDSKPRFDRSEGRGFGGKPKRTYGSEDNSERPQRSGGKRPPFKKFDSTSDSKPRFKRPESGDADPTPGFKKAKRFDDKPKSNFGSKPVRISFKKPPFKKTNETGEDRKSDPRMDELGADAKEFKSFDSGTFGKPYKKTYGKKPIDVNSEKSNKGRDLSKQSAEEKDGSIRLNRYIANSGICSRREADVLIFDGLIKVNGNVVIEMGYKVMPGDSVKYGSKLLNREKQVYLLLNKPKDFLTTTNDPDERKTVMSLIANACKERLYPVGRLDRQTTGLLLFTNDGELTEKLTHPSHNIKKIYQVELDRPITEEDAEAILGGLYFEEGKAVVDSMAVLDKSRKTIGIEIHIGWNRIVRRMFEAKGYNIEKLDRVSYAGLDKKDLPRGNWRILTEKEVVMLKHFN